MIAPAQKVLGSLIVLDDDGNSTTKKRNINARHDLVIGRDLNRCQWTFQDPHMSQQHLRIFVIIPPSDRPELGPLVYADDISRNGVYWNGSLISKKSPAFLLSDGDRLRLTSRTTLRFEAKTGYDTQQFSVEQERQMRVFCDQYVVTDRLLDATLHSRKFLAIEQRSRTQIVCEVIPLNCPIVESKYPSSFKRPRPAEDLATTHELQAVRSWSDKKSSKVSSNTKLERCFRTSKVLRSINHANTVSVEKLLVTDDSIYIFQELVPAGNLLGYITSKNGKLLQIEVAVAIRQILHAVQALHGQHLVHRNIGPTTILVSTLSATPRFVLTGYELARSILSIRGSPSSKIMADLQDSTVSESSPESKLHNGYEDLRNVGATAAFLLMGSDRCYYVSRPSSAIGTLGYCLDMLTKLSRLQVVYPEAVDFIKKLTAKTLRNSMSVTESLTHTWFSSAIQNADVQQICERAVQSWRPPLPKDPFIDFVKGMSGEVEHFACAREILKENRPSKSRSPRQKKPIEPPYKPFYRDFYQMAKAGDRAVKSPQHRGPIKLQDANTEWKKGISSSPSPTRIPSQQSALIDSERLSFSTESRGIISHDLDTITARPRLSRQPSFSPQAPDATSRLSGTECFPESPFVVDIADRSTAQRPLMRSGSKEVENFTEIAAEQSMVPPSRLADSNTEHDAIPDKLNILSPARPSSSWAFNIRSKSRLNARSTSQTRNATVTPNTKHRRSIFHIEDKENNSTQTLPASTHERRNTSFRDTLGGSGVTPHMAHLRLV